MTGPPATAAAAALWYAARGWPIFPLVGKLPAIPAREGGRGFHDATIDPALVAAWWRRWPSAGIGWALWVGDTPHVVLDDDGGAALELAATDRPLPATLTAATRRGSHYVYAMPAGVEPTGQPDPDIKADAQVRSAGFGYIVVEPSRHPSGYIYRWRSSLDLIAEAPEWLAEHVTRPRVAAVDVGADAAGEPTADDLAWLRLVLDLDPALRRLYAGRWRELPEHVLARWSDRSPSAADASLAGRLLGYGAEPARVARLMRASGLRRPKYGERRAGADYLTFTIARVAARRAAHV